MSSTLISVPSRYFEWKICGDLLERMQNVENGTDFMSEMFMMYSIRWKLMIYPNGKADDDKGSTKLCLMMKDLIPVQSMVVSIRYIMTIIESKTQYIGFEAFHKDKLGTSWGEERLSVDTFRKLNCCTIKLRVDLVDVYD